MQARASLERFGKKDLVFIDCPFVFKTASVRSSLYENKVLITKPFQASPSGKKLPTLFSMKR